MLRCRLGSVRNASITLEGGKSGKKRMSRAKIFGKPQINYPLFKKPLTCSAIAFGGFLLNEMDEKDSLQDILGFSVWTRDEAISAKGLCLAEKRETAKRILLGALSRMDDTGRIRTVLHPLISVLRMEWAGYFSTTRGFSCWFSFASRTRNCSECSSNFSPTS